MSLNRYAAKSDTAQRALVGGLKSAGIKVYVIRKPCDLLLYFWCNRHRDYCWQTLECKTPTKTGRVRKRNDQVSQRAFLEDTRTPIATDFSTAWEELNKRHALGRTDVPCVLKPIPA